VDLGRLGIWWSGSWRADDGDDDVAADMESLGYTAMWSSGGLDAGLAPRFRRLLGATTHAAVASGIVSIWCNSPAEISQAVADLDRDHPGRFVLGLGASHAVLAQDYARPFSHMVAYLDGLDALEHGVPERRRMLAALGPRMLELAATRAAGAHPYLVPVEHTARARAVLGTGSVLAPEVTVVLETDRAEARRRAREFVTGYLSLPNYTDNLRRFGFDDDDLAGSGSDRLVDSLVAWGDVDTVAARVNEHYAAGADHVCVQVVPAAPGAFPRAEYRALAAALTPR
jgi:probable F420-dependent oxidoreductase